MTRPTKTSSKTDTHNHAHPHEEKGSSPFAPNITFTLTAPWSKIQEEYEKALDRFAQSVEFDGFRKGKAPKTMVEQRVGKNKIYEAVIDVILPPLYAQEIKKRGLKPVASPHVHPISLEENKEWSFEVETAEAPKVELGNYKDIVKTTKTKGTIWTPGKDEKQAAPTEEDKLKTVFGALLESIRVAVPEILVQEEVNSMLSRLVQQLEKLHVTLDDYLKSVKKTAEELRQEYTMSALTTLQLEFIIAAIATSENIAVEEKEIDDIIQALPDENIRKANNTPHQRMMIRANLVKRKTIDTLLAL